MWKKEQVLQDMEQFKEAGYYNQLRNMYNNFSQTTCERCARCCTDYPRLVSYPEMLLIIENFTCNLTKEEKILVYKNLIRVIFYEKVGVTGVKCPFLNHENRCLIYKTSPIFCKLFGVLPEDDLKRELIQYLEVLNMTNIKNFFLENEDIHKFLNDNIHYCTKVKVLDSVEGKNTINYTEFKEMVAFHRTKKFIPFTTFFMELLMGQEPDVSEPVREYQSGNLAAINIFIDQLAIEKMII